MSKELLNYIVNREHHKFRRDFDVDLASQFKAEGLSPKERMTRRFEILSKEETPVFLPDEKICFVRTIKNIPDCFTEDEWADFREKYYILLHINTSYLSVDILYLQGIISRYIINVKVLK